MRFPILGEHYTHIDVDPDPNSSYCNYRLEITGRTHRSAAGTIVATFQALHSMLAGMMFQPKARS